MNNLSPLRTLNKLSFVTVLALTSLSAEGFEANILATTNEVYAVGGSYIFNEIITFGIGIVSVQNLKIKATLKDDFFGAYSTLELKKEVFPKGEVFFDLSYITGESNDTNINLEKTICGLGLKYKNDKVLSPYLGITTESTGYIGISKQLDKKWEIGIGVSHDFDKNDMGSFFTLSYNFSSGISSNIATALKNAIEKDFEGSNSFFGFEGHPEAISNF